MSRFLTQVLVLLAVLAAAGGGTWWFLSEREPELAPAAAAQSAPAPTPVEAAEVEVGTVTEEVTVAGTLRSNESVNISAEISGVISAIRFAEGEPVEAGTLLFELDDAIWRAELAEAEARFALSERNYDRAVDLLQKNVGTARTRDEALAERETARAVLGLARARLDKTAIEAPFAGILGLRKVSVGEYVTPGQALINLENIQPIKADFRIAERHLQRLRPGQPVRVAVESLPGQTFEGEIIAIDPEVDPESRSVAIRAQVQNEERLLRPGQFTRVNVVIEQRENAILVPEQALVPLGGDTFVFKVVDGTATLTQVRVGQRRDGRAEIVSGLAPGDVVVSAGHQKIRDGAPVQPITPDQVS